MSLLFPFSTDHKEKEILRKLLCSVLQDSYWEENIKNLSFTKIFATTVFSEKASSFHKILWITLVHLYKAVLTNLNLKHIYWKKKSTPLTYEGKRYIGLNDKSWFLESFCISNSQNAMNSLLIFWEKQDWGKKSKEWAYIVVR